MREPNTGRDMDRTKSFELQSEDEIENTSIETEIENESLESNPSSPVVLKERLDSMSLIDSSAKHLFSVMKGINGRDHRDVKSVCECASEIHKLMRLKMDAIWKLG